MLAKFAYDLQDLLALSRPRHTCDRHFFLLPLTKNSGHSQLPPSSNTHTAYSKPARLARYAKTEQPTLSSPTATTTQSEAQIVWRDTQRIAPKPFYAVRQKRSFEGELTHVESHRHVHGWVLGQFRTKPQDEMEVRERMKAKVGYLHMPITLEKEDRARRMR